MGALYVGGRLTHRERTIKTALLGGEALVGSAVVVRVLKIATGRQRPTKNDDKFWAGGDSFPSGHSMTAWSAAAVLATRYRDKQWVKFGAYGLASAISIARCTGKKHYPSDVLVGSVIGYLIGRYIALDKR